MTNIKHRTHKYITSGVHLQVGQEVEPVARARAPLVVLVVVVLMFIIISRMNRSISLISCIDYYY